MLVISKCNRNVCAQCWHDDGVGCTKPPPPKKKKKFALHVYVEGIAIAQITTSTPTPHMKSHKFDVHMEFFFQLKALVDEGGGHLDS